MNTVSQSRPQLWKTPDGTFVQFLCHFSVYEKRYPPSLSDEVWRLKNIGKDGGRCKKLYGEKILTVQDFRFLLSIDPQRLQSVRTSALSYFT